MKNYFIIFIATLICWSPFSIEASSPCLWEKISLDQVSSKAKERLLGMAGNNSFNIIEVKERNSMKIYRGSWTQNGVKHSASVTENGDPINKNEEINQEALPEKIQKLAQAHFSDISNLKFQKEWWVIYQINPVNTKDFFRLTAKGTKYIQKLEFDAKGNRIQRIIIESEKIPTKALEVLKSYAKNGSNISTFERWEGEEYSYGIEWLENGITYALIVLKDGSIKKFEESLTESQIPENLKKVIKNQFPNNQELEYEKEYVLVYSIKGPLSADGKEENLLLIPPGKKVVIESSSL